MNNSKALLRKIPFDGKIHHKVAIYLPKEIYNAIGIPEHQAGYYQCKKISINFEEIIFWSKT